MLVFGLCLVLGILLVVFTSLYHTTMPAMVPSVTVTPSIIPTVTPSSFKLIEDTFTQGGTETVSITSPLHIPEVGKWVFALPISDGISNVNVTPGDGYAVNTGGSSIPTNTYISNNILYNCGVDTITFDMHATFVGNPARSSAACGGFTVGFPLVGIFYIRSSSTMKIVINIDGTDVDTYAFASPIFDTLLNVSWTFDPTGLIVVHLDNVLILQRIIQIPGNSTQLLLNLSPFVYLNYAAITIVPPQV